MKHYKYIKIYILMLLKYIFSLVLLFNHKGSTKAVMPLCCSTCLPTRLF